MRTVVKVVIISLIILLNVRCDIAERQPADLVISDIRYSLFTSSKTLEIPNGTRFRPDNPNFDFSNPETWTGNMAKYVRYYYLYQGTYTITNTGGIAYDVEIDLHYFYDNNENETKTIYLGEIANGSSITRSFTIGCVNKQLIECNAEIFWTDYTEE